jgi:glutamyl-tRNA synthetase
VKGRFAPSPTGVLHLGNLRTALLAWLFARSAGSSFLVRVEDLDTGRVRPGSAEQQLADLAAIGLDWDGPVWVQSERTAHYASALASLPVYECFCTRAEIREAASAAHGPVGVYPGTCRELSGAQRAARRAAGRAPALRVRTVATVVEFSDRVLGHRSGLVDDFVVRRNDGAFAYNLAVVVDDAAQGIEEVVRGADLVDSTPRQIWLARALGYPEPAYAHVPLVLNAEGRRLAKRDGDVTLREVDAGEAVQWMARTLGLGGSTAGDLLAGFDPSRVPREPTIWHPIGVDPTESVAPFRAAGPNR